MSTALATERLVELELVIDRGLETFVEVGKALMEIRDETLYSEATFESYCQERWHFSDRRARQLIQAAEIGTMVPAANERQARALAPLRLEPQVLQAAWDEAVEEHAAPTAAQVREVVQRKLPPARVETDEERQAAVEKQLRWAATLNVLDGLAHFDRPAVPAQAEREATFIDQIVAATRGETITPERLRRASAWAALLADALERNVNA